MDALPGVLFLAAIFSGIVGVVVGHRCHGKEGMSDGFWHGFLLGPFGWLLVALYPRADDAQPPPPGPAQPTDCDRRLVDVLTKIHAELKWQRERTTKKP